MKPLFCSVALLLILSQALSAQDTPQRWEGTLDVKVMKLRLKLDIESDDDGKLSGRLISVDQGNAEISLDNISRSDQGLEFSAKAVGASFKGTFNDEKNVISGTFKQGGQSYPLEFTKGELPKPSTHVETWTGIMKAAGKEFDFQVRVFEDTDRKRTARLDSYSERVFGLYCDVTYGKDNEVTIGVPVSKAEFVGTLSEDQQMIKGKWHQSGASFDLTLTRVPLERTREPKAQPRPQTPKGPFPYNVVDVSFENTDAEIKLAGTLTSPKEGKAPVAVMITGSGPQDRDETILGHKPFAVIADHLSRNGIAVLRFDERGVGDSTGKFSGATSADLATDVEAAIEFLKTRDEIDAGKIILIGHSEGGLLAPMIASRRDDVAGVVLMAPPGINGKEIVVSQSRAIAAASGIVTEKDLDEQNASLKIAFEILEQTDSGTGEFIEQFAAKVKKTADKDDDEEAVDATEMAAMQRLDSPWFRFFAKYEPVPALEKTTCPTLVMIGKKDLQVLPDLNLPPIKAALEKAGNKDVTIEQLEDLNHLFQQCNTGSPSEYASIEQTFDPKALKLISDWIVERFK